MISFENVSKVYESGGQPVYAVEDVTLSVEKGEIFGIIGFSGAGKSTLLRLVNMLERPTSGTISIDEKDITSLTTKELRKLRQRIGMIFQSFNLFNSRTVFGNIAYPSNSVSYKIQCLLGRVKDQEFFWSFLFDQVKKLTEKRFLIFTVIIQL
nr:MULTISPECIES: ATP-binding cassette domain-containing protein [unclassified Bacillus (in: firmicutes)]